MNKSKNSRITNGIKPHKANSRYNETYMFVNLCVRITLRCVLYDPLVIVLNCLFHQFVVVF